MSLENYDYGAGAVIMPGEEEDFAFLRDSLICDTRPANIAEQFLVDQLLIAQWELERVRKHSHNIDAEDRLQAAANRASRNWNRAHRELTALQSARASQHLQSDPDRLAPPLANLCRLPGARKGAN